MAENLTIHAMGTTSKREEDKTEDNAEGKRYHMARIQVDQAMGEIDTIFRGGNGWGNDIVQPSAPCMLGITRGAAVKMTQQATTFPEGGNAPIAGKTAQTLHRALMGCTTTLHNIGVGGNVIGGTTGIAAAPPAATSSYHQQF